MEEHSRIPKFKELCDVPVLQKQITENCHDLEEWKSQIITSFIRKIERKDMNERTISGSILREEFKGKLETSVPKIMMNTKLIGLCLFVEKHQFVHNWRYQLSLNKISWSTCYTENWQSKRVVEWRESISTAR